MPCPSSDRTPPDLFRCPPAVRARFESHDAEVRKSRRRQPALSAGSEHDGRDHGGDLGTRGAGSRSPGAVGNGRLRRQSGRRQACGRRGQELDARQGRIAQARFGRTAVHDPDVRSTAGEIAPRRRRAHRARTLHAALRFCRRREIERREVGADHARSLSRRSHHGGPPEAAFVAGKCDARPERADVSRARRRRHHRPRHRKAAAALWRNDKRQDPFHSELGDACARRSRGRS